MKKSVLRYAAIGMASLSLAGFAAASTVTIGGEAGTGPDSHQSVSIKNKNHSSTNNENVVGVSNGSEQGAASGDVYARDNTGVGEESGETSTGDASNENDSDTSVEVTNGGMGAAFGSLAGLVDPNDNDVTIENTGPDSVNKVKIENSNKVEVNNTNVVGVENVNIQSAQSGKITAKHNTTVGDLSTGAASNKNTTKTAVTVGN